jgi:hypothetical protein
VSSEVRRRERKVNSTYLYKKRHDNKQDAMLRLE